MTCTTEDPIQAPEDIEIVDIAGCPIAVTVTQEVWRSAARSGRRVGGKLGRSVHYIRGLLAGMGA